MAIEKMSLLKVVGSLQEMETIIKGLILYENVNIDTESVNDYSNNYLIHQYETEIIGSAKFNVLDFDKIEQECEDLILAVEDISNSLDIKLTIDKDLAKNSDLSYEEAVERLNQFRATNGKIAHEIKNKKEKIKELMDYREKLDSIFDQTIEFDKIADLNFFDYEIGILSNENRLRLKKNYENLAAVVLSIGIIKATVENLYLIIYPKQYREETKNFLKSLSWKQFELTEAFKGTPSQIKEQIDKEVSMLENEIKQLSESLDVNKEENYDSMKIIYNVLKMEEKIVEIAKSADFGDNIFILDVWAMESDIVNVKDALNKASNKVIITEVKPEELSSKAKPPTKLKNNWFSKPFEMIVNMYDLPAYDELDPTPFVAVTFCLAFGIMFGDIGQGLVYLLAGLLLKKKMEAPAGVAIRLGISSMIFGCVYGSLFGLEKHELPWLPSLIEGGPLSPTNIPMILVAGVVFGIIVLTASYLYGTINSLRNKNIEEGIFGKNGIVGYVFFISFIFTIVALTGIINIPISIPLTFILISLIILILKEPITNLVLGHRPLFHESAGSYLTESIFEAIETILGALSNSISFVRVGAFALNHAGLFLAFMVISRMMPNMLLEILILVLGNILILSLEGLVVLIQSLRLHYYEMFSKYFKGGGVAFKSIKLS